MLKRIGFYALATVFAAFSHGAQIEASATNQTLNQSARTQTAKKNPINSTENNDFSGLNNLPYTKINQKAPMLSDSRYDDLEYAKSAISSARDSLLSGMPSLAQSVVENFSEKTEIPPELRVQLQEIYIDALIAQGSFELAQRQLLLPETDKDLPSNKIRLSLVKIGLGENEKAAEILDGIDQSQIEKKDLAWYHLAKGYALFGSYKTSEALKQFELAKKFAVSSFAVADAEIAMNICKISHDSGAEDLEKMEKDLSEKVRFYIGTPSGFQLAKQYAAVLFKLGKQDLALEVIDQQLNIQLAQEIDKDELKVIAAMMTKNPEKKSAMLREILSQTASVGVAEFALSLLSRNSDMKPAELREFLYSVAKTGSPKIGDRILLEIAKLSIRLADRNRAAAVAQKMLNDFPASRYKADALRILAWSAFSSDKDKPAEYRLAASHLSDLADIEKNRERALRIRMLSADCYYLNKDYSTAAKIYRQLYDSDNKDIGTLLNRTIEVLLLSNAVDEAATIVDSAYSNPEIHEDDIWNAEWKLISEYRKIGATDKISARIEHAMSESPDSALALRMMWLRARIAEESLDFARTAELCDQLLKKLDSATLNDSSALERIASNTMLMKARCYEAIGKADIGTEIYKQLREKYPDSEAAQLSYIYQARSEAALMHFSSALQTCRILAEKYPQGKYRYDAMSDAAEYARQIGLEADYRQALSILDKLCSDYPDDPRNFYARLEQAEILRSINAFGEARAIYNEIINKYPAHTQIYLAWMGLGDSTLAQTNRAQDAAAIFERLYYLPDMPEIARSEAAFKWGFALEKAGRNREADEVRWLTSSQLLADAKNNQSAAAAYWTARNLFALATSLESQARMRDARAAYELIIKHKLPSYKTAERKIQKNAQ